MSKIQDLDVFYTTIGENIKSLRNKLNYSQDDLAKFLNLTRTSVVNIEKGRQRPPLHTLVDVASFLDVDISKLLPSKDKMEEVNIRKSVEDNISLVERKFKDVHVDQEKLALFFQLSHFA
jgi:DNA-binding XRE family transcriptional regulator